LPSPQPLPHLPQSAGQPTQVSLFSQAPLPQSLLRQSLGQLAGPSPSSHTRLPHLAGHLPQSLAQVLQVSWASPSQLPLPHSPGHRPQSLAQVLQLSPPASWQMPSPHLAWQVPQSISQVLQFSPAFASQMPSEHTAAPQLLPHLLHNSTQWLSHWLVQQAGSILHTQLSQPQPPQPPKSLTLQP
jgi:hypothetical protein